MQTNLYTLGYEGLSVDAFVSRLQSAQVKTVVDVREFPLSRKQGFSKNALKENLAGQGIDYVHLAALGCPKPIRDQYRVDSDWKIYTKGYLEYLKSQTETVRELVNFSRSTTSCLVCFEADYSTCHRTYVAREARKIGGPVVMHLTSKTILPDLGFQLAA